MNSTAEERVEIGAAVDRARESSARQWVAAMDHAAEAVMICGADRRISEVNRAFTAITGFEAASALGRLPEELFWESYDEVSRNHVELALSACGHWKGDARSRRSDGSAYVESRSISAIRAGDGSTEGYVVLFSDITREKEDQRRLAYLAHHDELTGLPNRLLFHEHCTEAIARAKRHRSRVAVLYVDLDDFKDVNDTLGHAAGDAVLRSIAPRIQECLRKSDVVARLGGDEFTVVIDEVQDPRDIAVVARKMLQRLGESLSVSGHEVRVHASIGIACYPEDGEAVDDLLRSADTAMYAAKEQGRNNFQYFSSDLNARALEALILANNLRSALAREQFALVYQPRVDLQTSRITAVEALLRWDHPELGVILPNQFITVAEKTGLMEELGAWVLGAACRQMALWRRAGVAPPRIAVNLSLRQFSQPGLVEIIATGLENAGVDGSLLEVEVTEAVIMHEPLDAAATLQRIKALGVSVAIDDFGTGYSSLNHLQRLPVDSIKIDQSFVRALPAEAQETRITDAIMALSRTLGVRLIAEGIENRAQLDYMRAAQCEEGQGYLFSRPLAAEDLTAMLAAGRVAGMRGDALPKAANCSLLTAVRNATALGDAA